jgi:mRNA-degrading endonuclease HigB of HigAB toxin-antitoxin module
MLSPFLKARKGMQNFPYTRNHLILHIGGNSLQIVSSTMQKTIDHDNARRFSSTIVAFLQRKDDRTCVVLTVGKE